MQNRFRATIKGSGFNRAIVSDDLTFIHIDIRNYIWNTLAKDIGAKLINQNNVKVSIWDKRHKKNLEIDNKRYMLT